MCIKKTVGKSFEVDAVKRTPKKCKSIFCFSKKRDLGSQLNIYFFFLHYNYLVPYLESRHQRLKPECTSGVLIYQNDIER